MNIVHAKKIGAIAAASGDPKQTLFDAVGDLSGIEVMFNQVLVATYIRPEKSKGGIIFIEETLREDQFQSKTGLVLKKGISAFVDDDRNQFYGQNVEVGDWIVYRVSDGWQMIINGVHCRLIEDSHIRMRVNTPVAVF